MFLEGNDRKYMLLAWQSRKLKRIVKSTLTAETLALEEVIEVAYMMSSTRNSKARTAKSDFAYKMYH